MELTAKQLKDLVTPGGKTAIINNTVQAFNAHADEYGINMPLRKAHFLAQLAHESDHFNTTKEYGGSSKRYAPWYGRGLIQVTWEDNYKELLEWAKKKGMNPPDFLSKEGREQVAQFPWAFYGAVWYWSKHKLNDLADADDVRAITKKINGGYNGLDDRMRYLTKAKAIFGVTSAGKPEEKKIQFSVKQVQEALVKHNFRIVVDGVNGPATNNAVKMFQKMNGLVPDGVIGPKTAAILFGD